MGSSHKGIPCNEKADQAAKEALDEDIPTTESYPPDDLKKWLTEEDFKNRERKEAGRRQKKGYKRNANKRASGNIQTQKRIYEGHPRPQDGRGWQSTMPLLQNQSIRQPLTIGMQRNQRPENKHGHE
jgi:hypothetical protein